MGNKKKERLGAKTDRGEVYDTAVIWILQGKYSNHLVIR